MPANLIAAPVMSFLVALAAGVAAVLAPSASPIPLIARAAGPENFADRCGLAALIDASDLTRLGEAMICEDEDGLRMARACPERIQRPWTARVAADQE